MLGRKGFAISGIVGIGLIAAIFIALGFSAGSIQSLLSLLYDNFWVTFLIFQVVGLASVFVINSLQDNPKWKRDLIGWGVMTTVFIVLIFVPNYVSLAGYSADLTVNVYNGIGADPRLETVSVTNFEEVGPFSVARTFEWWPSDEVQVSSSVICDGEKVDKKSFGMDVGEQTDNSKTVRIRNLPSGKECSVTVNAYFENRNIGQKTKTFRVP